MLNNLFASASTKTLNAIKQGDSDSLAKLIKKPQWAHLATELCQTEDLLALAINENQPDALRLLLEAKVISAKPEALYLAALQNENSLSPITLLLQHRVTAPQDLWEHCLTELPSAKLTVHLSRLFEYGNTPSNLDLVLCNILATNNQPLVYFAVSSFKALPKTLDELDCDEDIKRYAKRCLEDIHLREQLSPF
ncbi:MAG: hypothetical protein ACPGPF_09245 [Pontibacterium sp.]